MEDMLIRKGVTPIAEARAGQAAGPPAAGVNPLGNVAGCGGALAFFLRGGTTASFVQANLAAVGR
jgi:hypothetical protein